MIWILLLLVILILYLVVVKKLHIDIKSFFKKGFKKIDNAFGVYCFTRKATEKARHFLQFVFLLNIKVNILILA